MIKLFRNIRKNLLNEGKTSKYFKYAIGEIILVVIGILIALSINNWNENRKERMKERQLLDNLQVEFQDNLKDLDSISMKVDQVIVALEKVFNRFDPQNDTIKTVSLDSLLSKALDSPNWRPSEYLLTNLGNSGSIADLKNENLKLLLYKWSRMSNQMHEVDIRTEKTGEEIISYLKKEGSLRNVDVENNNFNYKKSKLVADNSKLFSDVQFENHIDDKLYMYNSTRGILKEARVLLLKMIAETKEIKHDKTL
jgi:hypothetical protein